MRGSTLSVNKNKKARDRPSDLRLCYFCISLSIKINEGKKWKHEKELFKVYEMVCFYLFFYFRTDNNVEQ